MKIKRLWIWVKSRVQDFIKMEEYRLAAAIDTRTVQDLKEKEFEN